MIHLSKDPGQSLADALPKRRDPRLSRRARHAARIERRKGLRLFVLGRHDEASDSLRLARRYEHLAANHDLEGWANSEAALHPGTVTHADLQKAMPGISIEAITQLEERALEKRPESRDVEIVRLNARVVEPEPKGQGGILHPVLNQTVGHHSESGSDGTAVHGPADVPLPAGKLSECSHPASAHHPS